MYHSIIILLLYCNPYYPYPYYYSTDITTFNVATVTRSLYLKKKPASRTYLKYMIKRLKEKKILKFLHVRGKTKDQHKLPACDLRFLRYCVKNHQDCVKNINTWASIFKS